MYYFPKVVENDADNLRYSTSMLQILWLGKL